MWHSRTSTAGRRTNEDLQVKLRERKKNEAGSALLVVLGFLSFMVVSAVAFAIYMRTERVPSSALRRNAATRHLVRAAVAQAMSRVDDAIRNDPFPGLRNGADFYHDRNSNAMDWWFGRVFMPPDPDGSTMPGQEDSRFAPIDKTVSVLNLEALGYIPPPLVNDVRFLSRCSWTAKWQNFSFDAGRFAFCAVNVSDYFDINRATAGVRSSAPDSRISLAYILRENENKFDSIDTTSAKQFADNFGMNATMRQTYSNSDGNGGSSVPSSVPYISMLDYNLALGGKFKSAGVGGQIMSFFWQWVSNPKRYFYGNAADRSDPEIQQAARQTFIADSWNVDVSSDVAATTTNSLSGAQASQPFRSDSGIWRKKHDITMTEALSALNQDWNGKNPNLKFEPADWMTLFDYLDGNDYPVSLAFPCVERVPMVTAISPQGLGVTLNLQPQTARTEPASDTEQYQVTDYKLNGEVLGGAMAALIAFPFRHGEDFSRNGYTAQALVRVVMAPVGLGGETPLRSSAAAMKQLRPTAREWENDVPAFKTEGGLSGAFVFTARSTETPISIPVVKDEESMVITEAFIFNRVQANEVVFRSRVKQKKSGEGEGASWSSVSGSAEYQFPVLPFDAEGNLQNWDRSAWIPQTEFNEQFATQEFVPYVYVWVRIMKGDDAVDYVPAHYADDNEMLGVNNGSDPVAEEIGGRVAYPFLQWTAAGNKFKYPTGATVTPYEVKDWNPKTFFAVDPRFNWAPEDWLQSEKTLGKSAWLDIVDAALGRNGRDSDPFLFVSNQGYLQSIGELAFLPRLSNLQGGRVIARAGAYDGAPRTEVNRVANAACIWTSFRPYDMEGGESDNLFQRGVVDGEGSVAVNPYTDDANIRMAAFANTPYDWWAAGTNYATGSVASDATKDYFTKKNYVESDNVKESLKYAFTDGNSNAKLEYKDVEKIAAVICDRIRAQPDRPWEDVYDSLDWYGGSDPNDFMGVKLDHPLYGDDRKFLYAYWRGCFSNKQQLFLIFVRAESSALGGPGEGTPAQQGGRAVALVWREPTAYDGGSRPNGTYSDNNASPIQRQEYNIGRRPHRMRVLFYHQFD